MTLEKGTRELHTAPDPTSTVPCPLRDHQHIAMGRCVEYQRDAGCHCQHALVALRRTEKFLKEPTKGVSSAYDATAHADQLDGVRALIERAEAMERNRPPTPTPPEPAPAAVQQVPRPRPFLRPPRIEKTQRAIFPNPARNTESTPQNDAASISPIPARTPPAPLCEIPGCDAALRVNNLSGVCQRHRQQVPSRKRAGLVPDIARATGTAGDLIQQVAPAVQPEPSLVERAVASRERVRKIEERIDRSLAETKRRCKTPDCPNEFKSEKYDTCWRCRVGLKAHRNPESHMPAPAPAKEQSMPRKQKPAPCESCGGPVDSRSPGQTCGACSRKTKPASPAIAKPAAPPPPKARLPPPKVAARRIHRAKPRTLAQVAARHAPHSAPPADIVHLLEDKLAHHQEQAAKCERALQALR